MTDKKDKNIILFPGTVKLLTRKGRVALNEHNEIEALDYFQRAIDISPEYYQARFGEVLAYMKLERYTEAVVCTQQMLQEGIGDYYDVLHMHITLLINLGKFQDVVAILEGVLSEGQFPAKYAESFFDTLHIARGMRDKFDQLVELTVDDEPSEDLLRQLKSTDKKEQWQAIQILANEHHDLVVLEFKHFLEVEDNDILLKTIILRALKDMNVNFAVSVVKRGQSVEVIPSEMKDIFEESFTVEVEKILSEVLEHENPTLTEGALHIWRHYCFSLFPFQPKPDEVSVWAGAVHLVALESYGLDLDEQELASIYGVPAEQLLTASNEIINTQEEVFNELEF